LKIPLTGIPRNSAKTVNDAKGFLQDFFHLLTDKDQHDVTRLLAAWNDGDAGALDHLIDLLYPELRRIARRQLERGRAGESLESAAVANEAYLKLVRAGRIPCENRSHFLALCAQIMRRILVDHARRRGFAKRADSGVCE
jgi:RNA polymerase sigma factor (TIGR02999 family)